MVSSIIRGHGRTWRWALLMACLTLTKAQQWRIESEVRSRYMKTSLSATINTNDTGLSNFIFRAYYPQEAYLSNFTIEIDDHVSVGRLENLLSAKGKYKKNQDGSSTTNEVNNMAIFEYSLNSVPSASRIRLNITYEQMLQRRFGFYRVAIPVVSSLLAKEPTAIQICIKDTVRITTTRVIGWLGDRTAATNEQLFISPASLDSQVDKASQLETLITYEPSLDQQTSNAVDQFIVLYDVTRPSEGQLEISDGYFAHFFAPPNLTVPGTKSVVFVLDKALFVNGPTREGVLNALTGVLTLLGDTDIFDIVAYAKDPEVWSSEATLASKGSVEDAIGFCHQIQASVGSNLNLALIRAIELLHQARQHNSIVSSVFVITSAASVSAISSEAEVTKDVATWHREFEFSIHAAVLGEHVDVSSLQVLSSQNNGKLALIPTNSDLDDELMGVFNEISKPLLSQTSVEYSAALPSWTVHSVLDTYYLGGELTWLGRLSPTVYQKEAVEFTAQVDGLSATGNQTYKATQLLSCDNLCSSNSQTVYCAGRCSGHQTEATADEIVERMWAYSVLKNKSKAWQYQEGTAKIALARQIVDLSLKYNFVTELTSLVMNVVSTTTGPEIVGHEEGGELAPLLSEEDPSVKLPVVIEIHAAAVKSDHRQSPRDRSTSEAGQKCFKVRSPKRYEEAKNYRNYTATSRETCMQHCWKSSFCRGALYMPQAAQDNCRITYQAYPPCDLPEEPMSMDDVVLLYCIQCRPEDATNEQSALNTSPQGS